MPDKPSEKPVITITPAEADELVASFKAAPDKAAPDLEDKGVPEESSSGSFTSEDIDSFFVENLAEDYRSNPVDATLDLDHLTNADAQVVERLAKFDGVVSLRGLTEIDLLTAKILANLDQNIFFDSADGAAYIGERGIVFLNTVQLSPEAVSVLKSRFLRGEVIIKGNDCRLRDMFFGVAEGETLIESSEIAPWRMLFEKQPNFKNIVVEESAEITQYLRNNGVSQPERFHNLNVGRGGEALLAEVLQFVAEQPNGRGWADFAETFKKNTRKDFEADPAFMTIYLDETYQALADYLNRTVFEGQKELRHSDGGKIERSRAFLKDRLNDPQLADKIKRRYREDLERLLSKDMGEKGAELENRVRHAREILGRMNVLHLRRKGEVSYQLGSRSTRDLTWGDKCSDCTSAKIHGMNFWTVPTWATDPGFNFLLQYDEEGELAHKFGLVWELKLEKGKQVPILTIDSLELANEQKEKGGMYEKPADALKEKRLVEQAMTFIRSWAADMGLDTKALYSATISNTGTMELDDEYPKKTVTITKLGVLDASKRILKKTNPDYEGEVKVYLQSLVAEDQGQMAQDQNGEGVGGHAALIEGDKGKDFGVVERCFDQFLHSDSLDAPKVRSILELARTDSDTAARQMRIFLVTQARPETRQALAIKAQRIDVFLHARGHSLEAYLKTILGQADVSRGAFVKAQLFHLVSRKK